MKFTKVAASTALGTVIVALSTANAMAQTISFADLQAFPRAALVNDSVMGGVSRSTLSKEADYLRFNGNVSLANNGGFASVRFLLGEPLESNDRVQLRVKGDGQMYQLRFRMSGNWQAVAYSTRFQTIAGTWQTFDFLVEDFEPVWRSRKINNAPPLDLNAAQQLEVFISDKQQGDFELMLDTIGTL